MENKQYKGEVIIYQADDGSVRLDVKLEDDTVWLTQEQMAVLFGKGRTTITKHIHHIFSEGELEEGETKKMLRFAQHDSLMSF